MVLGNDAGPKKLEQISELKIVTIDEDALVRKLEGMFSVRVFFFYSKLFIWGMVMRVCVRERAMG